MHDFGDFQVHVYPTLVLARRVLQGISWMRVAAYPALYGVHGR